MVVNIQRWILSYSNNFSHTDFHRPLMLLPSVLFWSPWLPRQPYEVGCECRILLISSLDASQAHSIYAQFCWITPKCVSLLLIYPVSGYPHFLILSLDLLSHTIKIYAQNWRKAVETILKIASVFLDSQNLQLVHTLLFTFIWHLYHPLVWKYCQKCEIHAKKWHWAAILEIRFWPMTIEFLLGMRSSIPTDMGTKY
jgi:hypothetical protein